MTTQVARWAGWRRAGRELRTAVVDLLLPPHCAGCGAAGIGAAARLCGPCAAHLQWRPAAGCGRCGDAVLPGQACRSDHDLLRGLAFARAPFRYAGTGGALVRRLKLSGDFAALPLLAAAMAVAVVPMVVGEWRRAVVVPVPLHRRRRRARGFDQARLLAGAVARRCSLPLVPAGLRRTAATWPQGDPRVTSRERNVAGAFAVARPGAVDGRCVVLVDDVITSGATARACAGVLVAAGAHAVALLTACRA